MKKIISLYGLAACGKSTQAQKISDEFGLIQFGMGDRLRNEISSGSELGQRIKAYVDQGILIDDNLMSEVIASLGEEIKERGIIFDGFPRILSQAKMLDEIAVNLGLEISAFVYLKLSTEEAVKRIQLRSEDGVRDDDRDPQAIANRLATFERESRALLDYYQANGKLVEVNGELSISEVYAEIKRLVSIKF